MKKCLNPIVADISFDTITKKYKLSHFHNLNRYINDFGNHYAYMIENDENRILLPCRKCINCQLNKAQEWAIRNTLEASEYDSQQCLFITLTYSPEHTKSLYSNIIDYNGHIYEWLSLKKTDFQMFVKKLRDVFKGYKIRYFGVGEYGGITKRPHYHLLVYGLSLDDIVHCKYKDKSYAFELKYTTSKGSFYYSELFEKEVWAKGFVDISLFSPFTAGYVSRYCTKKLGDVDSDKKLNGWIFYNNLQKEFNLMSLKPAIAYKYYVDNKLDIYKDDEFFYHFNEKTIPLKPFKIWDKYFDVERPDEFEFVRQNRKDFANLHKYFQSLETNIDIAEYLRNESDLINKKLSQRSIV